MTTKRTPNTLVLPDGRRVVCRIWDKEECADRYTIAFRACRYQSGKLYYPYLGSSERPFHPLGYGQYGESDEFLSGPHLGKRVRFRDLPESVQRFIYSYFDKSWQ